MKKFEVTYVYDDCDEEDLVDSYVEEVEAVDKFEAIKKVEQMFMPVVIMCVEEVK